METNPAIARPMRRMTDRGQEVREAGEEGLAPDLASRSPRTLPSSASDQGLVRGRATGRRSARPPPRPGPASQNTTKVSPRERRTDDGAKVHAPTAGIPRAAGARHAQVCRAPHADEEPDDPAVITVAIAARSSRTGEGAAPTAVRARRPGAWSQRPVPLAGRRPRWSPRPGGQRHRRRRRRPAAARPSHRGPPLPPELERVGRDLLDWTSLLGSCSMPRASAREALLGRVPRQRWRGRR